MESWAIILLILVMASVFLRGRKINYAIMTFPLGAVPLARIISGPVAAGLRSLGVSINTPFLRCGVIVIGSVVSCILIWALSKNISSLRVKRGYVIVCVLFSICLAGVLAADVLMVL